MLDAACGVPPDASTLYAVAVRREGEGPTRQWTAAFLHSWDPVPLRVGREQNWHVFLPPES
ncbi:hypothetical protein [Streptosporangium sp. NPDC000396]|uniref:hypothetical protein n=1 Tax=Streptosporangium sp. NPDC000396 TaxID=3366185 RepID=UPI0036D1B8B2